MGRPSYVAKHYIPSYFPPRGVELCWGLLLLNCCFLYPQHPRIISLADLAMPVIKKKGGGTTRGIFCN